MAEIKSPSPLLVYPDRLPALALRDFVFFPSMVLPLLVGRPRSVAALKEAVESANGQDAFLLLVAQKDVDAEEPSAGELHRVGTVTRIVQSTLLADGTHRVVFEGRDRVEVRRFLSGPGPYRAEVRPLAYVEDVDDPDDTRLRVLMRRLERSFREYAHRHPDLPADLATPLGDLDDPARGAHLVAGHLLIRAEVKQNLLEAPSLHALFHQLLELLDRELEILQIEGQLDFEMRRKVDDDRRQHYLQEQLRAIQKELGSASPEWDDLQSRLTSASLPEPARERVEREFERLTRMNPSAPEAGVIRGYLEWILSLPWTLRTEDNPGLARAQQVLEEAHFGLTEVKDRILDHIAVLALVGKVRGPILCLVGPPGVGKTSLGRSIAHALNRRFVRVALGGIRDEAEIRGHRRTYVGSLPGRILQGIRRAESRNPVFLLDEVDKLVKDGHGDPSSALLEVLDPEQNHSFQDHYLELEFDLSEILFVATANTLAGIPEPLRDRMEIIRIPGYLDTEKLRIAEDFLIPEQLKRHGLSPERIRFPSEAVNLILDDYTREAGVRELDRMLARAVRKVARKVAEGEIGEAEEITLGAGDVREFLGPPRHLRTGRDTDLDRVGMATGLAWTAAGGELLEVEVSAVPGSGIVQLTGTLGDVMKESAVAAVTFARARAGELGLRPQFHRELDLHIHIPEGATPKDGPSAGITIAAALISALTGVPTRDDVATTGEITLRGRILPVGGIKEKAVAALRSGITMVVLPSGNAPDLDGLPPEIRNRVTFQLVRRMDQVLDLVLATAPGLGTTQGGATRDLLGGPSSSGTRISQ